MGSWVASCRSSSSPAVEGRRGSARLKASQWRRILTRIKWYTRSYHTVDSSDSRSRSPLRRRSRKACSRKARQASRSRLRCRITVPEENMGDVISDLNGSAVGFRGMDQIAPGTPHSGSGAPGRAASFASTCAPLRAVVPPHDNSPTTRKPRERGQQIIEGRPSGRKEEEKK